MIIPGTPEDDPLGILVVTRDVNPRRSSSDGMEELPWAAPTGCRSSREQLRRDAGAPVGSSDGMQELPWAAPTGCRSSPHGMKELLRAAPKGHPQDS